MTDQYYIDELQLGDEMEGFYLLKSFEEKVDRNGYTYYTGYISDISGDFPFRIFNSQAVLHKEALNPGDIVFVSYKVEQHQGQIYASVLQLRPKKPTDQVDISEILPMAPIDAKVMFEELLDICDQMSNEEYKAVASAMLLENQDVLLTLPGGKTMHHNVMAGLLYHMYRMTKSGLALADIYPEINRDLIAAGAIVHDIGKLQEYSVSSAGMIQDFTPAGDLLSHNILGILMLQRVCDEVNASQEVFLPLAHMIESHHGEPDHGSAIRPMFLEADLLHHLDMIDSRIWIFDSEQAKIDPGTVSKPVRSIQTPVYRPVHVEERMDDVNSNED